MLALASCAGSIHPEKTVFGGNGNARGQWRGQAYVQSLNGGKSGTLNLDILAHEPSQMRIEATGSFDVPVASIALNGDEIHFVLPREKKFISAKAGGDTLVRLIAVPISINELMDLLFDRPLDGKIWTCTAKGPEGQTLEGICRRQDGSASVDWDRSDPNLRKFKFESKAAIVDLHITEAKAKVEAGDSAYDLPAPNGYTRETYSRP